MAIVDSLKNLLKKFGGDPSALEENATSSDVIDAISEAYTDKEGTYTEVTPIGDTGDKIATITTNNTAHDIYAPKELPAVTSEDAGMVLSVNSEGAWAKANPPTELPAVTSADEGDVLGVNASGEWVKMNAPSGGGAELFEIQLKCSTASPYDRITANKTAEEVLAALNAGKIPYLKIFNKDSDVQVYRSHVMLNNMSWEGSNSTPEMTFVDIENGGDGVVLILKWHCDVWGAWDFEGWYLDSTQEGYWPI